MILHTWTFLSDVTSLITVATGQNTLVSTLVLPMTRFSTIEAWNLLSCLSSGAVRSKRKGVLPVGQSREKWPLCVCIRSVRRGGSWRLTSRHKPYIQLPLLIEVQDLLLINHWPVYATTKKHTLLGVVPRLFAVSTGKLIWSFIGACRISTWDRDRHKRRDKQSRTRWPIASQLKHLTCTLSTSNNTIETRSGYLGLICILLDILWAEFLGMTELKVVSDSQKWLRSDLLPHYSSSTWAWGSQLEYRSLGVVPGFLRRIVASNRHLLDEGP